MKLNEIQAFVSVAETGSVQAAALRLHMTQSAVSRLVQRLEADLRVVLFDRQTKPLSLTHDGRTALDHGRRALAAAQDFSEAMSPAGDPAGALRLGSAHALATRMTARPLDLLRAAYPQLAVQVSSDWTGALLERLSDGSLDAALIMLPTGAEPRRELHARRLHDEDIAIIGAARLAARPWGSLRDLNGLGWVIQPEGCGYRAALKAALEQLGAGPMRVAVEAFGQDLQLSVIARGAGFGLLPARQLAVLSQAYGLAAFAVPDFRLGVSLWFVRQHHMGRLAGPLDEVERVLSELE